QAALVRNFVLVCVLLWIALNSVIKTLETYMTKLVRICIILILINLALAGALSANTQSARATQTPDLISGDWDALFKVGEHTSPATFKLKLDGDKVTGTAETAHTGPGTVRDGSWKG